MSCFMLFKHCIVFVVAFIISRLFIILIIIRRRRTAAPRNLLTLKDGCVRTLIVLGSGTWLLCLGLQIIDYLFLPFADSENWVITAEMMHSCL